MDATLAPDFKSPVIIAMDKSLPILEAFIHFPVLRTIVSKIPPSTLMALNKTLEGYNDLRKASCF